LQNDGQSGFRVSPAAPPSSHELLKARADASKVAHHDVSAASAAWSLCAESQVGDIERPNGEDGRARSRTGRRLTSWSSAADRQTDPLERSRSGHRAAVDRTRHLRDRPRGYADFATGARASGSRRDWGFGATLASLSGALVAGRAASLVTSPGRAGRSLAGVATSGSEARRI
jgi:hypothetical protein